jgi:hypothetical protein
MRPRSTSEGDASTDAVDWMRQTQTMKRTAQVRASTRRRWGKILNTIGNRITAEGGGARIARTLPPIQPCGKLLDRLTAIS